MLIDYLKYRSNNIQLGYEKNKYMNIINYEII